MRTMKKEERVAISYSLICLAAYIVLRNLAFVPWLTGLNRPSLLYKCLFALVLAALCCTPLIMILEGKNMKQWREVMKTPFWRRAILIASCVAFLVLVVEIWKYIGHTSEAICVTVAAFVIYVPNVWGLTCLIGDRCKKDSSPTE